MKKLRIFLHSCETRLEEHWQKLSATKQRKYIILFFAGYLLVTACVVTSVWYDAKSNVIKQKTAVGHIRNPIIEQEKQLNDSSSTIIKNKDHERQ